MMQQAIRAFALGITGILGAFPLAAQAVPEQVVETADLSGGTEDAVQIWQEDRTTIFDATEIDLEDFLWIARPVVVFGESPFDPSFQRQMEYFAARPEDLAERDVVVVVDTDPAAETDIRLRLRPRGFMLAIISKEGQVTLRKPLPWSVRELTRSIDKMPLRQQEIDAARGF